MAWVALINFLRVKRDNKRRSDGSRHNAPRAWTTPRTTYNGDSEDMNHSECGSCVQCGPVRVYAGWLSLLCGIGGRADYLCHTAKQVKHELSCTTIASDESFSNSGPVLWWIYKPKYNLTLPALLRNIYACNAVLSVSICSCLEIGSIDGTDGKIKRTKLVDQVDFITFFCIK